MKTHVENHLFFPHNALNKALAMNLSFLRVFATRSVKTSREHAERAMANVKTRMTAREWREYRDLRARNYPATDAKAAARAASAMRKAADSCLKEMAQ